VQGDLTEDDLLAALINYFPQKAVHLANVVGGRDEKSGGDEIIVSRDDVAKTIDSLTKRLEAKEDEFAALEITTAKLGSSIQAFHSQQKQLYDEFVLLRSRYDEQKNTLVDILWGHCGQHHPELIHIPKLEDENNFDETDERVGEYTVGDLLGEGQFATVKLCWKEGNDTEWALKIIKKERITTFAALKRVSNEIDILRQIKSPYVVGVVNAMQTKQKLYIVTEKGGSDLFEFFDEHPEGVPGMQHPNMAYISSFFARFS
jgi:hypothetical protein